MFRGKRGDNPSSSLSLQGLSCHVDSMILWFLGSYRKNQCNLVSNFNYIKWCHTTVDHKHDQGHRLFSDVKFWNENCSILGIKPKNYGKIRLIDLVITLFTSQPSIHHPKPTSDIHSVNFTHQVYRLNISCGFQTMPSF